MLAIPALHLRGAQCLEPTDAGEPADVPLAEQPAELAARAAAAGFGRLHVVLWPSQRAGLAGNAATRELIRAGTVDLQVHLLGQTVDQDDALDLLAEGADRVILDAGNPSALEVLRACADAAPGRCVAAIEFRNGLQPAPARGATGRRRLDDALQDLEGLALGGLLIRAARGNGSEPDLALLEQAALDAAYPVTADGVVATLQDLRALEDRGLAAAVIGRALHLGVLDARLVAEEFGA